MHNQSIILSGLTPAEFQSLIREELRGFITPNTVAFGGTLGGVDFEFNLDDERNAPQCLDIPKIKYLTRGEVSRLLKISLPTLYRYTKDGILRSYRIGSKIRYKLEEIELALKERNFGLPKKGGCHE
jgi:excisionase family DNA binding protein